MVGVEDDEHGLPALCVGLCPPLSAEADGIAEKLVVFLPADDLAPRAFRFPLERRRLDGFQSALEVGQLLLNLLRAHVRGMPAESEARKQDFQRGLSQPAPVAKCQIPGWDIGSDTTAKIEGQARWVDDAELVLIARTLDLDILYIGDFSVSSGAIIIPHPRMHERRFVLRPLAEIRPALILPGQTESVAALLAKLADRSGVEVFAEDW